jgi:hypothetical protein
MLWRISHDNLEIERGDIGRNVKKVLCDDDDRKK